MGFWISILLLLIVVVLWQVYTQIEAFTAGSGAQDASGTVITSQTRDASGGVVSTTRQEMRFSPEEILAALSGAHYTEPAASSSDVADAPASSAASTKEMEERLAKRISSQIKSELLSQRATEHPVDTKYAACELSPSDAEAQGAEYTQAKPGFNINNYVRKDSIPCWGCSLPPA